MFSYLYLQYIFTNLHTYICTCHPDWSCLASNNTHRLGITCSQHQAANYLLVSKPSEQQLKLQLGMHVELVYLQVQLSYWSQAGKDLLLMTQFNCQLIAF